MPHPWATARLSMEGSARWRARAHGSSDEPLRGRLRGGLSQWRGPPEGGSRAMLWSPCARCALQSRAAKQTKRKDAWGTLSMEGSARGRARALDSSDEPLRGRLRVLALQPNRTRRASGIACNALARGASRGRTATRRSCCAWNLTATRTSNSTHVKGCESLVTTSHSPTPARRDRCRRHRHRLPQLVDALHKRLKL